MTINEVAELAGVSRATVSRYLNQGYVSEEKREKIRKAIEETGYVPSVQAQNLRSKKTRLIGIVIPKINSDTVSRMVAGVTEELKKSNYQLLLGNAANDVNEELRLLEVFQEKQVDGVIFSASMMTAKQKELIKKYKVPIVIMGQRMSGVPCVYHDDYAGARAITEQIIECAEHPGYIGITEKDVAVGKERRRGFECGLAAHGKTMDPQAVEEAFFSEESGYQAMKKLYKRCPELDTIVCATDSIAVGAMKYLQELGKRIPQDIQIVGMGDTAICRWMTPTLASVHFYYKTCGAEAAKLLLSRLESGKTVNKEIKMGYEVVTRESLR